MGSRRWDMDRSIYCQNVQMYSSQQEQSLWMRVWTARKRVKEKMPQRRTSMKGNYHKRSKACIQWHQNSSTRFICYHIWDVRKKRIRILAHIAEWGQRWILSISLLIICSFLYWRAFHNNNIGKTDHKYWADNLRMGLWFNGKMRCMNEMW